MNRTISLVDVSVHLSLEMNGATEKTVTVQEILDLSSRKIEIVSYLDKFSRHFSAMFYNYQETVLVRLML